MGANAYNKLLAENVTKTNKHAESNTFQTIENECKN